MEYRHDHKKEKPRIPIPLRSFAYGISNTTALLNLGKNYYEWSSKKIAKIFLKFNDVREVFLIGGGLDRCKPLVSDLDFVLVTDTYSETELLLQLRKVIKKIKLHYPILGEVHVVHTSTWNAFLSGKSASKNWFNARFKFIKDDWIKEQNLANAIVPAESKVALGLYHYWKAHSYLSSSLQSHKMYYRAHFEREISKAIDFTLGENLKIRKNESWHALMSTALSRIETISECILNKNICEPRFKIKIIDNAVEIFGIEVKQNQWKKKSEGFIRRTTVPGVVQLKTDSIQDFYRLFSQDLNCPVPLKANAIQLIKLGLGWGAVGSHLNWLWPKEKEDQEFISRLLHLSEIALWNRYRLNSLIFRGKIVSVSIQKLDRLFQELFYCFYSITNQLLTNDLKPIDKQMQKMFPNLPSKNYADYLSALQILEREFVVVDEGLTDSY